MALELDAFPQQIASADATEGPAAFRRLQDWLDRAPPAVLHMQMRSHARMSRATPTSPTHASRFRRRS